MKTATVAEMKARLSSYLKQTQEGPVVVTSRGKPVAILISVEDEDEMERLVLAYSPRFQAVLAAGREQVRKGGGIPHDEFWKQVAERRKKPKNGRR